MKNLIYIFGLISAALFLCGFESGVTIGDKSDTPKEPTQPVLQYEKTVSPAKSNIELYQEYYLLIVTSLKEAQLAMPGNQQWAYRMVHNAYKYAQLQEQLVYAEHQDAFSALKEKFVSLIALLKKNNATSRQLREIDEGLKETASVVEKEFRYETAASWIKQ